MRRGGMRERRRSRRGKCKVKRMRKQGKRRRPPAW
jgi:hypothetical protein